MSDLKEIFNLNTIYKVRLRRKSKMLTYNFEKIGSDSIYEYLYKCIKNDIIQGKIKQDDKLPSKRSFAKNLGISVITVESAYEQLMAEGYIYSIPKKGFYVSEIPARVVVNENTVARKSSRKGNKKVKYVADFGSNQMESDAFPFTIWAKTVREVLNDKKDELMINPPIGGCMELREAIAVYLEEFRGMTVSPEQIFIGAGTEYLYSLIIQLMGNRYTYGVENPGHVKVGKIYESMNVPVKYIGMDKKGVIVEELENSKVDIMHICPSHHFPTGTVMPISRRYEMLGWASQKNERYIIEDDYDSELRLSGKPIPTLQSIDVSEKVIYMNTFTKTLSSTVRVSYMVLPMKLAKRFYKKLYFYSGTVSNFDQYTLARFMETRSFEKHINRLRNYYQKKRDIIIDKFENGPLKNKVRIEEEEAGIHFLMTILSKKTESEIVEKCACKGIRMLPLSTYYNGDSYKGQNIYVMNYSSIDVKKLDEVVGILDEII